MSFTVVPLHHIDLPAGSRIPFGNRFVLQDIPMWLKKDEGFFKDLSRSDRFATLEAKQALVAEYPASSIGHPDPEWKGHQPRSIQNLMVQSAFLANIAIWLIQPSRVRFTLVFHALTTLDDGRIMDPPVILRSEREVPFCCQPKEEHNVVSARHVIKAAKLFETLDIVPRNNAVWAALRAFSAALSSYYADYRYPLFWQGLESLFGSDNERYGVTKRLCDRISIFVADTEAGRQEISDMVRTCYAMRSEILHGRWENDPDIDQRMADTEAIVRTVVRHLLEKPGMLRAFISPVRDDFLNRWVASNAFDPPTCP